MNRDPDSPAAKDPSLLITRKRLGRIRHVDPHKKIGFIEAEDYRDDVFFHWSLWESVGPRPLEPRAGMVVEFEIDELYRREQGRLRVKWVRPTKRPWGAKMTVERDPHLAVKHHPRARQAKPSWRSKPKPSDG
jgi:cold shock CspA family protein